MITCKELTKNYKKKSVVNDLTFEVKQGEVFALLGSNGAGKTTTIKMILDLVKNDCGTIEKKDGITIGYSPETPYFYPFLTGRETLRFYGKLQNIPKELLADIADELLELVGLRECGERVKHYSKGMTQRLAVAQALLGDPDMLILDEPTAGLDAVGRAEMIQLIERLRNAGKTILVNSHILSDLERVCDRGIIIKEGRLLREWKKSEETSGKTLEEIFLNTIGGGEKW